MFLSYSSYLHDLFAESCLLFYSRDAVGIVFLEMSVLPPPVKMKLRLFFHKDFLISGIRRTKYLLKTKIAHPKWESIFVQLGRFLSVASNWSSL